MQLLRKKQFWVLLFMMLCAGASEQAVSQWASAFAEQGLGVTKTVGDLAGPMAFAALMGVSRLIFGKHGQRMDLDQYMRASCLLCLAAYACIVFVPMPVVGLLGCAICGFSVGIFWPGTFSKATAAIPGGGTAMFALLALAGDLGCAPAGPTLAGLVSDVARRQPADRHPRRRRLPGRHAPVHAGSEKAEIKASAPEPKMVRGRWFVPKARFLRSSTRYALPV